MESDNAIKYGTFYSNLQTETIVSESYTDDVFESIVRLYQKCKNAMGKVWTVLLIQSSISTLMFQSTKP